MPTPVLYLVHPRELDVLAREQERVLRGVVAFHAWEAMMLHALLAVSLLLACRARWRRGRRRVVVVSEDAPPPSKV